MQKRHPQVVNIDEVEPMPLAKMFNKTDEQMGSYGALARRVGATAGAKDLGCTLYEVEPGRMAFPLHWHLANEEAIIVLAGVGTLRIGAEQVPVRAGDYIALPTGTEHAHQLKNTGTSTLRYYCLSTKRDPEVAGYPESKKIGVLSMAGNRRFVFREEDTRDYLERDPNAGK
jgi:uncharacterized cupin superfamily protein